LKKYITLILLLLILLTISTIIWLSFIPEKGEGFTEFYILGQNGKAQDYPIKIEAGKYAEVTVGIVNKGHTNINYHVLVKIDNIKVGETETILLENGQKHEQLVSISPLNKGDNQKVEFLLYKDDGVNPYLSLNLWIDVK